MSKSEGFVDCDIHPMIKCASALYPYLEKRWQTHLETYGHRFRQPFFASTPYPKASPGLARRDAWPPNGGPPGSDLDFMREQHLDRNGVRYGLLQTLYPSGKDQRNEEFGAAICSAVNDWLRDSFLVPEPRLKAAMIIPYEDAACSVQEIERQAGDPNFVQVSLCSRTRDPLGQKKYWPIYEAAVRHNLPISIHVGGLGGHTLTGAGWPTYYFEEHHGTPLTMQTSLLSMIFEGVFERFPDLKVVLVEGGFAWLPALAWRADAQWGRMKDEVPHLTKKPSDYIRNNVWVTTQPMEEAPNPQHIRDVCEWIGFDSILFSTDYPHWDFDDPRYVFKFEVSREEKNKILFENALAMMKLD